MKIKMRTYIDSQFSYWGHIKPGTFAGPASSSGEFLSIEEIMERTQMFTNLKNKDGKEIWEGDCFKTSDKHGNSGNCIAEVKFIEGCFGVHVHRKDLIQVIEPLYKYLERFKDSTEIIGNIIENPKIVKEKKTNGN